MIGDIVKPIAITDEQREALKRNYIENAEKIVTVPGEAITEVVSPEATPATPSMFDTSVVEPATTLEASTTPVTDTPVAPVQEPIVAPAVENALESQPSFFDQTNPTENIFEQTTNDSSKVSYEAPAKETTGTTNTVEQTSTSMTTSGGLDSVNYDDAKEIVEAIIVNAEALKAVIERMQMSASNSIQK